MSTSVLKALPGKPDIKRHSSSILYISTSLAMSTSVLKALPGKPDIKRHSPSILYISQGHNLYKLQNISLEEVKIVSFQQWFQSEAIESNLLGYI